jgi:hypothetical protein
VRQRDDHDVVCADVVDDLIRKPLDHQPPFATSGATQRRTDIRARLNELTGFSDFREKFGPKSRPVYFVPTNCFREFSVGFRRATDWTN